MIFWKILHYVITFKKNGIRSPADFQRNSNAPTLKVIQSKIDPVAHVLVKTVENRKKASAPYVPQSAVT
jgi:hypothetical protein